MRWRWRKSNPCWSSAFSYATVFNACWKSIFSNEWCKFHVFIWVCICCCIWGLCAKWTCRCVYWRAALQGKFNFPKAWILCDACFKSEKHNNNRKQTTSTSENLRHELWAGRHIAHVCDIELKKWCKDRFWRYRYIMMKKALLREGFFSFFWFITDSSFNFICDIDWKLIKILCVKVRQNECDNNK